MPQGAAPVRWVSARGAGSDADDSGGHSDRDGHPMAVFVDVTQQYEARDAFESRFEELAHRTRSLTRLASVSARLSSYRHTDVEGLVVDLDTRLGEPAAPLGAAGPRTVHALGPLPLRDVVHDALATDVPFIPSQALTLPSGPPAHVLP